MPLKNNLINQYSGKNVENYEKKRNASSRWANEIACFESVIRQLKPKTIVDSPVGTCRWADIYFQYNVENVIGLDASQDMLNRSRDILIERGITNFDLKKVDLINGREIQLSSQPELVACIRFLNWLNFSQVQKTFSILSSLKSSYILIGVSVYDNKRSVFSKTSAILSHYFENIKRLFSSLAPIYVHNKKNIELLFSQYQWEILSCNPIFEDRIRMNFFYLLKRNNKI